jgi:hypothetical protein
MDQGDAAMKTFLRTMAVWLVVFWLALCTLLLIFRPREKTTAEVDYIGAERVVEVTIPREWLADHVRQAIEEGNDCRPMMFTDGTAPKFWWTCWTVGLQRRVASEQREVWP